MTFIILILPVLAIVGSVLYAVKAFQKGTKAGKAVVRQICSFVLVGVVVCALAVSTSATSSGTEQAPAGTEVAAAGDMAAGMAYLAAAIVTGLSGIGGGIAVAAGAPAAIGATSEDPKAFGKSLIFVALGEGIALYGLLVSILILAKV